jgi:hypothetical protein
LGNRHLPWPRQDPAARPLTAQGRRLNKLDAAVGGAAQQQFAAARHDLVDEDFRLARSSLPPLTEKRRP